MKPPPSLERRDFLKTSACLVTGAAAFLTPPAIGLRTLLDPLTRTASPAAGFVRVASLQAIPADGVPRRFQVIAGRTDAWNRYSAAPIGAVYLRRTSEKEVSAFNVTCPHAGCFVDYAPERKVYFCPCHNSSFALDGSVSDLKSPSPRGLDTLPVEIRPDGDVWVRFQNYRTGIALRIPV